MKRCHLKVQNHSCFISWGVYLWWIHLSYTSCLPFNVLVWLSTFFKENAWSKIGLPTVIPEILKNWTCYQHLDIRSLHVRICISSVSWGTGAFGRMALAFPYSSNTLKLGRWSTCPYYAGQLCSLTGPALPRRHLNLQCLIHTKQASPILIFFFEVPSCCFLLSLLLLLFF